MPTAKIVPSVRHEYMLKMEKVRCDLCGEDDYSVLFEGRDRLHHLPGVFPVVKCRRCSLVYLNPRPDEDSMPDYYPDDYSPHSVGRGLLGKTRVLLRKMEASRIGRMLPRGGRVLEVGCAAGDLLVHLKKSGVDVSGIEVSPLAASLARNAHGLVVHTGTVFDAEFEENSFDAVVMRHVIEHVPSAARTLERVGRFLKEGGFLYITTPNFDSFERRLFGRFWHALDSPRHLTIFSVDTIRKMLEKKGFEVVRIKHSLIPNNWVCSTGNILEEYTGWPILGRIFSLKNPLTPFIFLPFGILQKILLQSGTIEIVAEKRL